MEKKMVNFGFEKLLTFTIIALSCICMWGCSDTEFRWNDVRSGAKVVGFVDDSLVMVGDYRCWTEITDGVGANYKDIDGCGQERLCVYNYRVQENGPRWCDSLSNQNSTGIFGMEVHSTRPSGQMTDSVIWGGHIDNSIRLWKIGELPHEIRLNKKMEGCSVDFTVQSVKQWLDGTFIARGEKSLNADGDGCQYAVLDTLSKTITYKRLDKDLEWIKQCDDVRAWGNDVYCLKKNDDERTLKLFVQNEMADSIDVNSVDFWDFDVIKLSSLSFYGDVVFGGYLFSIDFANKSFDLTLNVRPLSFPSFGSLVDDSKKGFVSY